LAEVSAMSESSESLSAVQSLVSTVMGMAFGPPAYCQTCLRRDARSG
jgi:hypothetical protein